MSIDVNTEGSYRLHLDFIMELVLTDQGYNYHFQENETSITLTVTNEKGKELYKHETDFLDKRRPIEQFLMNVIRKGIETTIKL